MSDSGRAAQVFVLAGVDRARSFELGERTVLGRSSECDIVLQDRSISRKHAVIVRQEARWFVQDLGSTNGVHKDGERIERAELRDGDEFQLGDLPLRMRLQDAAPVRDDGIEFASPLDALPPVAASLQAAVPARPAARPPSAEDDGIEIEMDAEIEAAVLAQRAPTARPADAHAVPVQPRAARRSGLFSGDLEQHPLWVRALIVLALLVLGAGLCYGAFLAVQGLRSDL